MEAHNLSILILAAGRGTRMYSDLPKVLHEIGGKPMLAHVIDTARSLSPQRIGVVVGFGKEAVRARTGADGICWIEQTQQLGTGHAVKTALSFLPSDGLTLVLYGDVPLIDGETLRTLVQAAADAGGMALLTDILDNPFGYGRIQRRGGKICGIIEEKDLAPEEKANREVNTGMMVLPNAHLPRWLEALSDDNAQGEYYLTDVVAQAAADGVAVAGVPVRAHYLAAGVNNKIQLADLERLFQRNRAEKLMKAGVTLRDPARFDIRGSLQHGRDCVIDAGVIVEGECTLGSGVHIGAHCVLKNAVIGDGVEIKPFSHLENCTVGAQSQIGPFSRLRPDARLGENVHIGNFVEVKKSTVGDAVKINHLTYIGDAVIGEKTNIGAGTITCNYDGVNKFRTEIGADVRIGSGTMIVAPVKIGDKATTGAGSVITDDCPPEKLSLARSKQITHPRWRRPEKK